GCSHASQFDARQESDCNTVLAAFLDQALQTYVVTLLSDPHPLKPTATGFERLHNCVDAEEHVHEGSSVTALRMRTRCIGRSSVGYTLRREPCPFLLSQWTMSNSR